VHTFVFTALEECSAPVCSANVTAMLHSIESSKMIEVTVEHQMSESRCGKMTLLKNLPSTVALFEFKRCVIDIIILFIMNKIFVIFGSRVI
jgi:hypothetical protein